MSVILFADDQIFVENSQENKLFKELVQESPTLGLNSIHQLEESFKSIGNYNALILDWDFGLPEGFEDIQKTSLREEETFNFLIKNDFYSLIYIFSANDIENGNFGEELKQKFGNRIKFKTKNFNDSAEKINEIKNEILQDLTDWKSENSGLELPIEWGQNINQSIQKVFSEFAESDENWIREIYKSADNDGLDAKAFVVELMQTILTEHILINNTLLEKIKIFSEVSMPETVESNLTNEKITKLFTRLFYTKLNIDSPLMTGDIYEINNHKFGIVITPECNIRFAKQNLNDNLIDILELELDSFTKVVSSKYQDYTRENYVLWKNGNGNAKKKVNELQKIFNQDEQKLHCLPSFIPYNENLKTSFIIDFSKGLKKTSYNEIIDKRTHKLNAPFIQQLRQRFISYFGRVGVPAIPIQMRDWNLE